VPKFDLPSLEDGIHVCVDDQIAPIIFGSQTANQSLRS